MAPPQPPLRGIRIPADATQRIEEVLVGGPGEQLDHRTIGAAIMGPDAKPCFIERVESAAIRGLGYDGDFSFEPPSIDMWLDEQGLLVEEPKLNARATLLAGPGYHIVGPVVLLGCELVEMPEEGEGYAEPMSASLPERVTLDHVENTLIAILHEMLS